jgi:hypothetical protein
VGRLYVSLPWAVLEGYSGGSVADWFAGMQIAMKAANVTGASSSLAGSAVAQAPGPQYTPNADTMSHDTQGLNFSSWSSISSTFPPKAIPLAQPLSLDTPELALGLALSVVLLVWSRWVGLPRWLRVRRHPLRPSARVTLRAPP